MNILYYGEPDIDRGGGVGKVAYYLPEALKKKVGITCLQGISSNNDFLKIYSSVFSQFFKKEFDIFHFNANPVWFNGSSLLLRFAKLRQTRTVLNVHGITQLERKVEQWNKPVSFSDWMSTLNHCNLADRIVVNSEYMRNHVVDWYRLNRDKVVVIPNGVDLKLFARNNDKIVLEGDPSVLYVGHFARLKGLDILIQAIAKLRIQLPNIKLHLVGRGAIHHFAFLAKKEGLEKHVVFHDWVEHSKLPRYYKSADICVFPSRHEGFGLVILEAMASGIPLIASDIPAFREIISNGVDGRLFKSEDADDLSSAVIALYQCPHLRRELSRNAFEKATRYSWEKIADKYISLYRSLCDEL